MTKRFRTVALAVLGAIGLSLMAPTAAHAGSRGRRNTAIALGAVALYGVVKKKPLIAGLGAAGAVYSYVSSRNARRKERERDRWRRARYYGGGYQPRYYRSYAPASYYGGGYGGRYSGYGHRRGRGHAYGHYKRRHRRGRC